MGGYTNVSKSLWGGCLLASTYTKTGRVLTTAATAAFISAYITQKAQGLEVLGEGKGAVILFYIF